MFKKNIKKIIFTPLDLLLKIVPKNFHYNIEIFLEKLSNYVKKNFSNHDEIINLKIGSLNFSLKARRGNLQAHTVYKKMRNEHSIYEISIITCLKAILENLNYDKKNLFIDVGSFIGYYTCYVSKYKNSLVDVVSIESNPDFSQDISDAIKINKLRNVQLINKTLSDSNSQQYVYREMSMDLDYLEKKKDEDKNFYENIKKKGFLRNSVTLDDLDINFDQYKNINIMKIDAHGAEARILSGGKNILQNISYLLLELHTDNDIQIYSPGYSKKKVIENLINLDFQCYLIGPHADIRTKLRNLENYRSDYFNYKKKFDYVSIEKDMIDKILFDRNLSDIFILGVKKGILINDLKCFK